MSARPSHAELHAEHAYEAAWAKREARARRLHAAALQDAEAEVRRMAEERWQRRLVPMLQSVRECPSDFPGCVW